MITFSDTAITACFVSPQYCQELLAAGLSERVHYYWKVYDNEAELNTHWFDKDNYYVDGENAFFELPSLKVPDHIYAAYSVMDIEKHVPPDYVIMFNTQGKYQLMPSNLYPVEGCSADRLPDVFAKHLLQCIRKRIVDIQKINSIIAG